VDIKKWLCLSYNNSAAVREYYYRGFKILMPSWQYNIYLQDYIKIGENRLKTNNDSCGDKLY
jgi:hypothetical protein